MKVERLTLFLILSLPATLCAQNKHEIIPYIGWGMSSINYHTEYGKRKDRASPKFGVEYNYHIDSKWSIASGLEVTAYRAEYRMPYSAHNYMEQDENESFELRTTICGLKEKQKLTTLNIPLLTKYRLKVEKKHYITFATGIKLGIPLKGNYTTSYKTITSAGYYPQYESVNPQLAFREWAKLQNQIEKGNLKFKMLLLYSFEAGMHWKLSTKKHSYLYSGLCFDIGLNNIKPKSVDSMFLPYNPIDHNTLVPQSILVSKNNFKGYTAEFSEKSNIISIGIKLGFTFSIER